MSVRQTIFPNHNNSEHLHSACHTYAWHHSLNLLNSDPRECSKLSRQWGHGGTLELMTQKVTQVFKPCLEDWLQGFYKFSLRLELRATSNCYSTSSVNQRENCGVRLTSSIAFLQQAQWHVLEGFLDSTVDVKLDGCSTVDGTTSLHCLKPSNGFLSALGMPPNLLYHLQGLEWSDPLQIFKYQPLDHSSPQSW